MKKNILCVLTIIFVFGISINSHARLKSIIEDYGINNWSLDTWIVSFKSLKNTTDEERNIDEIPFGSTDDEYENNKIWWQILYKKNGVAILKTRNNYYYKKYDNEDSKVSWADSDIRKWLNEVFYNNHFTDSEKSRIVKYDKTDDYVFLLSKEELETYIPDRHFLYYKWGLLDEFKDSYIQGGIGKYPESFGLKNSDLANVDDDSSLWIRNDNDSNVNIYSCDNILNEELDEYEFFEEYKVADANKYAGFFPVICVKYDEKADIWTEQTLSDVTFGLGDTVKSLIPKPIYDVLRKRYNKENE